MKCRHCGQDTNDPEFCMAAEGAPCGINNCGYMTCCYGAWEDHAREDHKDFDRSVQGVGRNE
jgi:hypothetical protein